MPKEFSPVINEYWQDDWCNPKSQSRTDPACCVPVREVVITISLLIRFQLASVEFVMSALVMMPSFRGAFSTSSSGLFAGRVAYRIFFLGEGNFRT